MTARHTRSGIVIALALACAFVAFGRADAKIVGITVTKREPFAAGAAFGAVGAYTRVDGTARGELDPADRRNAVIDGIALAPRNARGMVEYETDFSILTPAQAANGSGTIVYDVPNRGRKFLLPWLLDAPSAAGAINDPATAADTGTALAFRRGYTIVWSGWEPDAPRAGNGMTIRLPVETRSGAAIVHQIRDEFVYGTRVPVTQVQAPLSYEAASTDRSRAALTVRERQTDAPVTIAATGWTFADTRHVALLPAGTAFRPGAIYEFTYEAKDPKPLGIGFAATRDLVSYLRYERNDLAAPMRHALGFGISQSGRFLRSYLALGFNADESGRIVFDGVLTHISGSGGVFANEQFAQPSRTNTQHEDHDYPEYLGSTASLFHGDRFDPYLFEVNTSTEFWQKGASLDYTDTAAVGESSSLPRARQFLIAGTQHAGRAGLTSTPGTCAVPRNPHNPAPALRALLVALDDWVSHGTAPPPSRVPTLADRTLVRPAALGFPALAGVTPPAATNAIAPIADWVSGRRTVLPFDARVPAVDADGNETSGIRLPDVTVPLGTFTGWNFYGAPYPTGELCDREGTFVPFASTAAQRGADPRLSLTERYGTPARYLERFTAAANALVRDRVLLREDADRMIAAAAQVTF